MPRGFRPLPVARLQRTPAPPVRALDCGERPRLAPYPLIRYTTPFTLILCYNTPTPMPIEAELARLDGMVYAGGRTLRVLPVPGSRSKAENINYAMKTLVRLFIYGDIDRYRSMDGWMDGWIDRLMDG